ncbi:Retrovirus-related Pol polyprotein from transposon TNT 1-94 [Araneus ventricosus]|uniref:Retrovirus-related Pol polyprotein from transposon TNT 1-94 n=1 Tax=Araneus ventricosus TaxID=182803 RepID=A0A4Y2JYR5_ARAVE|nr:Retrovirus-related Pol polyprotein from transposon TNT 1-94 [Araneus ventricosus]
MSMNQMKNGSIFVEQTAYAKRILHRFYNITSVLKHNSSENDAEVGENVPYREAVGSLMYLATATRPDIAYSYLKGISDYELFSSSDHSARQLKIYTDAGDSKTRRSRIVVDSKFANGAISWASQKQKSVVLSTTEAEYVAECEGAEECIWLSKLLNEIGATNDVLVLYVDNALKLVNNPEYHKRSKHIDVKFNFIREKYQEDKFSI